MEKIIIAKMLLLTHKIDLLICTTPYTSIQESKVKELQAQRKVLAEVLKEAGL